MFIYKWPADKENDTGIVGQHSSCDVQGKSPLSAGHPRPAYPLTVGPREPALLSASADSSRQTPLLGARGPLQAGAAGAPPREAASLGLRMAVDSSQKRSPREHLEGLGLAWPEIGSTPQVEREGSRGAGGHTQAGPWGGRAGRTTPRALSEHLCAHPLVWVWQLGDHGWPTGGPFISELGVSEN